MKELTLVFLVQADKVLLAVKKRGFGAGRWNGIGGKLDPGESVAQAMVRECQEEVFVTPTEFEKTARIVFHESVDDAATSMLVHVYVGTEWEGDPAESEEMAPQWFQKDSLPFDTMWPDDPYWLPQVLAGHKIEAEFTLKDNDIIVASRVDIVDVISD